MVGGVDGILGVLLELGVVVDQIGLVCVDVPYRRPRHLRPQRLVGQRIVEIAELAVEQVAVRPLALELQQEIGEVITGAGDVVGSRGQGVDRVFLVIGVQVADDEEIRVAASCRVGGEPVGQDSRRQCPGQVAVPLHRIVIAGPAIPSPSTSGG